MLLRRISVLRHAARVAIACAPAADYGRVKASGVHEVEDGAWIGRVGAATFRWDGARDAVADGRGALRQDLALDAGDQHDLTLVLATGDPGPAPKPGALWAATAAAWRAAVPPVEAALAPRDARHACAVLHGLTSPGGGGMVAAASMSLPERADAGRSYDYRYAWVRDQSDGGRGGSRVPAGWSCSTVRWRF